MKQARAKVIRAHFLSFKKGVKGCRLWHLKNKKKVMSRDVIFDENFKTKHADEKVVYEKNHIEVFCQKMHFFRESY